MSAEDRVTAALHALADGAPVPADGESRLVGRLRREHRRRRAAAVVGSVAIVVGIVAVAATVSSTGGSAARTPLPFASGGTSSDLAPTDKPDASASPSPAPTYPPPAAGVGGPTSFLALDPGGKWAFHDSRTGESSAAVNPTGYAVTTVAAGGDQRTYYTAATKGTCGAVHFSRVEVVNGDLHNTRSHDVPGTTGVTGQVISIAISPDGSKLAYSIATKANPAYTGECSGYEVRVIDLRTGTTRSWTGEDATPSALAWAPDDRTLLMHVSACCGDYNPGLSRLDTTGPGQTFLDLPVTPGTADFRGCGISVTTTSNGAVYAGQECYADNAVRVVELDPVTGKVRRQIATILGLELVRTLSVTDGGAHVLMSAFGQETEGDYRIDDGRVSRLSTNLEQIAW